MIRLRRWNLIILAYGIERLRKR